MIFIFLGVPGAGKGTIASRLIEREGYKHISTGDVFRENIKNKTELGMQVKQLIAEGNLVPDEVTNKIASNKILEIVSNSSDDYKLILDGYPRTVDQSKYLENFMKENNLEFGGAIYMDANKDVVVDRISSRFMGEDGKTYNSKHDSVVEENGIYHLENGLKLTRRPDDEPEMVIQRFVEYVNKTAPLVDYYKEQGKLVEVFAEGGIEEIYQKVNNELTKLLK